MKIGFIGAGKVGFSLGKYLSINNLEITGYYSKNINSAKEAAVFTNSNYFSNLEDIINQSDIIFITTQDSFIKDVWDNIKNFTLKDKIICHCSGSLSSNIFSNIAGHDAYGYSVHPMFAFSDKYNSYKNLNKAFISIEGSKENINLIKDIFETLGNRVKIISKDTKYAYHCASVFASNHVVALINIATALLKNCGFTENEAIEALYPLILNNIQNINEQGIVNSLTGPVERADINTVKGHISSLSGIDKDLYLLLSEKLIEIAKVKNTNIDYSNLEKMIGEY